MESKEFIRANLVSRTNAVCSSSEAKNNRWHYRLRFEGSIGVDWLETQVRKCSAGLEVTLELWEIHPSGMRDFEIEVREVERREGIDSDQIALGSFEA